MPTIRLDTDLRPVTEFRANAAALIAQVRATRRPLLLTQRGRGAVVLVAVEEFQKMLEACEAPAGGTLSPVVEAYKSGIDRSLIRENLRRPPGERLRRLAEMAEFSEELRRAPRRPVTPSTTSAAAPEARDSSAPEDRDPS